MLRSEYLKLDLQSVEWMAHRHERGAGRCPWSGVQVTDGRRLEGVASHRQQTAATAWALLPPNPSRRDVRAPATAASYCARFTPTSASSSATSSTPADRITALCSA